MAKGLGAGLEALLGSGLDLGAPAESSNTLPIEKIEPRQDQPRKKFDEDSLAELSASIAEQGIVQPVVVRPIDGGFYQIIAGERRWRAARMAGLEQVPVRIIDADDRTAMEMAMVENLQRENLDPIEEALGYRALSKEYGMTQEEISQRVGKSRPVVANALRLLSLPEKVQEMVSDGRLTHSIARLLLELEGEELRLQAAETAAEKCMTAREVEALIKRMKRPEKEPKAQLEIDYVAEAAKELTRTLGRKVNITGAGKKGKITLDYFGTDDFERLYAALCRTKIEE